MSMHGGRKICVCCMHRSGDTHLTCCCCFCCCCCRTSYWLPNRALVEGAEGEAKQELSEGQLRLGLVECLNHSLLHPYPVLHEKPGDLVAQVRAAAVLFVTVSCYFVMWIGRRRDRRTGDLVAQMRMHCRHCLPLTVVMS